ncbi:MAG: CoA transferase [Alphaproteobacteria bacterium]|nr:CoA transferase [Alphaproteobacteria bacterium]
MRPLQGREVGADRRLPAIDRCARWLEELGATVVDGDQLSCGDVRVALPGAGDDPVALGCEAGVYDGPVGPARWHPLDVPGCVAAAWAGLGLLAATLDTGRGGSIREGSVPVLDAAITASELSALLVDDPPRGWEPVRWAASPWVGTYACADGRWVQLHAGLPSHLARLLRHPLVDGALAGLVSPETLTDPLRVGSPREAWRQRRALRALFRRHPARRWEEGLGGDGLCAVMCRTEPESRAMFPDVRAVEVRTLDVPLRVPSPPDGRPLGGLRVVDLTQVIAGPTAGRALAALGAEVTKVVDPGARQGWVEAFRAAFDAGKRILPLDLRTEAGRASLHALLRDADVVIHGFRPEAADRLGVSDAAIRRHAPAAVIGVVSAYGWDGPFGGWPGWEQTAQALAGTELDYGRGRPDLVPLPATDLCTGLLLALGTVAALVGGRAARVDATLLGTALELRRGAPGRTAVRRAGLKTVLGRRPELVRRVQRPGLGALTEIGVPLSMAGVERFPEPGPGAVVPDRVPRRVAGTLPWVGVLVGGRIGG